MKIKLKTCMRARVAALIEPQRDETLYLKDRIEEDVRDWRIIRDDEKVSIPVRKPDFGCARARSIKNFLRAAANLHRF